MLRFNNQNNLNHHTQSRRSRGMWPPVRTGWRQWVAIYRQLPHRGGVQLFLLLWEGVQFFLILANFLCSAIATVSLLLPGRFFSSTVHFTTREGCALPLVITPVPSCCILCLGLSLYFGSHYQPQNNRTRLNGSCVVASFCLSVIPSFCLSVCYSCLHQGRREDKCWVVSKKEGWKFCGQR